MRISLAAAPSVRAEGRASSEAELMHIAVGDLQTDATRPLQPMKLLLTNSR
jgi:hypothetical protein